MTLKIDSDILSRALEMFVKDLRQTADRMEENPGMRGEPEYEAQAILDNRRDAVIAAHLGSAMFNELSGIESITITVENTSIKYGKDDRK